MFTVDRLTPEFQKCGSVEGVFATTVGEKCRSWDLVRGMKVRVKKYQTRVVKLGKITIYQLKIRLLVINFEEKTVLNEKMQK